MPANKTRGKKPRKKSARPKSLYAQTGENGRKSAQKKLLLATLRANKWNMTVVAEQLGMAGTPAVIKAIRDVGIYEEYHQAKTSGRISPASRRAS